MNYSDIIFWFWHHFEVIVLYVNYMNRNSFDIDLDILRSISYWTSWLQHNRKILLGFCVMLPSHTLYQILSDWLLLSLLTLQYTIMYVCVYTTCSIDVVINRRIKAEAILSNIEASLSTFIWPCPVGEGHWSSLELNRHLVCHEISPQDNRKR